MKRVARGIGRLVIWVGAVPAMLGVAIIVIGDWLVCVGEDA